MSGWQVGDILVCVDVSPRRPDDYPYLNQLVVGRSYVLIGMAPSGGIVLGGLRARDEPHYGWWPDRFRKVLPDKHEACETEFVTLLQRIKRKQVA